MNDWSPFLGMPLWVWLFVLPTLLAILCRFFPIPVDKIYTLSGVIAAIFMVSILLLIIAQMVARWSGIPFEGSSEFAGYIRVSILLNLNNFTKMWLDAFAMFIAALTATYFARYAIKTNYMSEMLNDRTQGQDQVAEWFLSFFTMFKNSPAEWVQIWESAGDKMVYTPVWLPQLSMSIGTILLAIALWDNLTRLLINNKSSIEAETVA